MDVDGAPLRGPKFSSYSPDEIGWLVTDLSTLPDSALDGIRRDALGNEYEPSSQHFERTLDLIRRSARKIAYLVGVTSELALARRGPRLVLASAVRAGVPVGILMRRWMREYHGIEVDHFAMGVHRGRGVDPVALRWLADHYDPARVLFVDAWTGKGGVAQGLKASLQSPGVPDGFSPSLAVLTDPGHCTDLYGTRDDVLLPFAGMNSKASGLVSGAVPVLADAFYVARFFHESIHADLSDAFLTIVTDEFAAVAKAVSADWHERTRPDPVDRAGERATEAIARRYGVEDAALLVRPGFGETLRVLLSNYPGRLIVNREAGADLEYILELAERRGLPIDEMPGMPYACAGLMLPPPNSNRRTGTRAAGQS